MRPDRAVMPPKADIWLSRDAALAHPTFLMTVTITFCVTIGREQRREVRAFT